MEKPIYLDYAATTPVDPEVLDEMLPYFNQKFGNPSSVHPAGKEARRAVEKARERVAGLINAEPEEIIFTGGGTEADNMAIIGSAGASQKAGNHIVTTNIEHHAVFEACRHLSKQGFTTTFVPVESDGIVDIERLKQAITDKTVLVSVIYANNEIGTIQPVKEIAATAHKYGIPFHSDAVQAIGREHIDVRDTKIDMLSLSGHKFYGPKGVGALYLRRGTKLLPITFGGGQEKGLRPGTANVPLIVGLGKAAEIAGREIDRERKRLKSLRDRLITGVLQNIEGAVLNGDPEKRLPNNASFCFNDIAASGFDSEDHPECGHSLSWELGKQGICASAGAACTAEGVSISHVLTALDRSPELAQGALRFSLGKWTTEAEIDRTLEELHRLLQRLREKKRARS
jgi:cysteine desulfurase